MFRAVIFITVFLVTHGFCKIDVEHHEKNCSEKILFACTQPLDRDLKQLHFVSTKEELHTLCSVLETGLRCIDNFTRTCMEPHQRSVFNHLYSGTSIVIHEICSEGPFQTEFLKHASCTKLVASEFSECARLYENEIAMLKSEISDENETPAIKADAICFPLKKFLDCTNNVVRETCGAESANFSAGLLDKMSQSIVKTYCDGVNESNAANRLVSLWFVGLPALLLMLNRLQVKR